MSEKRFALLVGTTAYTQNPLDCPLLDVEAMEKTLKNRCGFTEITTLCFSDTTDTTYEYQIERAFKAIAQKINKGLDTFFSIFQDTENTITRTVYPIYYYQKTKK